MSRPVLKPLTYRPVIHPGYHPPPLYLQRPPHTPYYGAHIQNTPDQFSLRPVTDYGDISNFSASSDEDGRPPESRTTSSRDRYEQVTNNPPRSRVTHRTSLPDGSPLTTPPFSHGLVANDSERTKIELPGRIGPQWTRSDVSSVVGNGNLRVKQAIAPSFANPAQGSRGKITERISGAKLSAVVEPRGRGSSIIPNSQQKQKTPSNQPDSVRDIPTLPNLAPPQCRRSTISALLSAEPSAEPSAAAFSPFQMKPYRLSPASVSNAPPELAAPPFPWSDGKTQIEAVPTTRESRRAWDVSSLALGGFSHVPRYEGPNVGLARESTGFKPIALVPDSALASQISDRSSQSSPLENPGLVATVANTETSTVHDAGQGNVSQCDPFKFISIGGSDNSAVNISGPVQSFESPDTSGTLSKEKGTLVDKVIPPAPPPSPSIRRSKTPEKLASSPLPSRTPLATPVVSRRSTPAGPKQPPTGRTSSASPVAACMADRETSSASTSPLSSLLSRSALTSPLTSLPPSPCPLPLQDPAGRSSHSLKDVHK